MAREQLPAVIEQPADRTPMPALVQDAGGAGSFVWEEGRKGRKDGTKGPAMLGRKDRRCCATSAVNMSRNRSVDCPLDMRHDSPDRRRHVGPNRPIDNGLRRSARLALLRSPRVLSARSAHLSFSVSFSVLRLLRLLRLCFEHCSFPPFHGA
jgi:hypothetical protein